MELSTFLPFHFNFFLDCVGFDPQSLGLKKVFKISLLLKFKKRIYVFNN